MTIPGIARRLVAAYGHWHRMLARPPRFTKVDLMDRATRRAKFSRHQRSTFPEVSPNDM
jgi:hypothetical protein